MNQRLVERVSIKVLAGERGDQRSLGRPHVAPSGHRTAAKRSQSDEHQYERGDPVRGDQLVSGLLFAQYRYEGTCRKRSPRIRKPAGEDRTDREDPERDGHDLGRLVWMNVLVPALLPKKVMKISRDM